MILIGTIKVAPFPKPSLDFLEGGFRGRLQQRLGILFWITVAEHGVACHQNFRAGTNRVGYGIERDPTIYFDAVGEPALAANLS